MEKFKQTLKAEGKKLAMQLILTGLLLFGIVPIAWFYCHAALWLTEKFPQVKNIDILLLVGLGYLILRNLILITKIIDKKYE